MRAAAGARAPYRDKRSFTKAGTNTRPVVPIRGSSRKSGGVSARRRVSFSSIGPCRSIVQTANLAKTWVEGQSLHTGAGLRSRAVAKLPGKESKPSTEQTAFSGRPKFSDVKLHGETRPRSSTNRKLSPGAQSLTARLMSRVLASILLRYCPLPHKRTPRRASLERSLGNIADRVCESWRRKRCAEKNAGRSHPPSG